MITVNISGSFLEYYLLDRLIVDSQLSAALAQGESHNTGTSYYAKISVDLNTYTELVNHVAACLATHTDREHETLVHAARRLNIRLASVAERVMQDAQWKEQSPIFLAEIQPGRHFKLPDGRVGTLRKVNRVMNYVEISIRDTEPLRPSIGEFLGVHFRGWLS